MAHDFRSYKNPSGIDDADRCCKCERPKGTQEPCLDEKAFTPWWADERRGGNELLRTATTMRLNKSRHLEGES